MASREVPGFLASSEDVLVQPNAAYRLAARIARTGKDLRLIEANLKESDKNPAIQVDELRSSKRKLLCELQASSAIYDVMNFNDPYGQQEAV